MQLAAQLDPALKPAGGRRSLPQKWRQMRAAWEIERTWTKPQILEAYLNLAVFRGELTGIRAASSGLFGKESAGLDEGEALLLVALLRSPNASVESVARRACRLGLALGTQVPCDSTRALAAASLNRTPQVASGAHLAPHVARQLLAGGERRAQSSLDASIQRRRGRCAWGATRATGSEQRRGRCGAGGGQPHGRGACLRRQRCNGFQRALCGRCARAASGRFDAETLPLRARARAASARPLLR